MKMLKAFLIMSFASAFLAGCATIATSCAGLTRPPSINKPAQLTRDEPNLTRWIVSTDEFIKACK